MVRQNGLLVIGFRCLCQGVRVIGLRQIGFRVVGFGAIRLGDGLCH